DTIAPPSFPTRRSSDLDEVAAVKRLLGFDPEQSFVIEDEVLARAREVAARGRDAHGEWQDRYAAWRASHREQAVLLDRLQARERSEEHTSELQSLRHLV